MGRKNNRMKEHIPSLRRVERDLIHPRRMEIWFASLPQFRESSEQGGNRPVLIVSNDIVNARSNAVTVIPLTSKVKHTNMPTHVILDYQENKDVTTMALVEQITTIDKRRLLHRMGESNASEAAIEAAIREQVGLTP